MRRRIVFGLGFVVTACAAREPAERASEAPLETPRMQTAPLARTTITETTVATVSNLSIGVGSLWDADWTNPDGSAGHGPTAMVAVADAAGASLYRKRLHAGDTFSVEGHAFRVLSVVVLESALGHVVLEHSQP